MQSAADGPQQLGLSDGDATIVIEGFHQGFDEQLLARTIERIQHEEGGGQGLRAVGRQGVAGRTAGEQMICAELISLLGQTIFRMALRSEQGQQGLGGRRAIPQAATAQGLAAGGMQGIGNLHAQQGGKASLEEGNAAIGGSAATSGASRSGT